MKRKRWWIPIFVLLVLLLLASIPRIYGTELAAVDQMDACPVLKSAYEDICNQYPLHEISTEDTFYVVTIKNLGVVGRDLSCLAIQPGSQISPQPEALDAVQICSFWHHGLKKIYLQICSV